MAGHGGKTRIDLPGLARADAVNRGLHVVKNPALGNAAKKANGCSSVHLMMPDTEFAASLLHNLVAHLDRRFAFNRWVDVTFSTNDLPSRLPYEILH